MMPNKVRIFFRVAFDLILEADQKIEDKELLTFLKVNPKKENEYRASPRNYFKIIQILEKEGFEIESSILQDSNLSQYYLDKFKVKLTLRDYQERALKEFLDYDGKGIIVLPTAAGKTVIGLKAIAKLKQKTVIIVPTKNLLYQWIDHLTKYASLTRDSIGQLGDQIKEIKDITVTTYDSARLNLNQLRKNFNFVILDEAHHAGAKETLKVLEGLPSAYRLGLTATPNRSDKGEEKLYELIGKPIKVASVSDLSKNGYVADYEQKTIKVPLDKDEREVYNKLMTTYREYLKRRNIQIRTPEDYERYLIFRVNQDHEAKEALDAHRNARNLVFSSKAKLHKIEEIIIEHLDDQIIIFSEFNDMVYDISRRHLIPAITHETKSSERNDILQKFSRGIYSKIVTGKVLDEGWDCGNVNVGIIVSGTGQARQFIQRLGRILRPKEGKSILYELVTPESLEVGTVRRRKQSDVI